MIMKVEEISKTKIRVVRQISVEIFMCWRNFGRRIVFETKVVESCYEPLE